MPSLVARINELKEKRKNLIEVEARGILAKSEAEKRDLTSEEDTNWTRALGDADKVAKEIERLERQDAAERTVAATTATPVGDGSRGDGRQASPPGELELPKDLRAEYAEAFRNAFGPTNEAGEPNERAALASPKYRQSFRSFLRGETRAHQADNDVTGGYLKAPPQFVAQLLQAVDDALWIRQLGTVIPVTSAASLGVVSLDSDPDDFDWTGELTQSTETADMTFGKRELKPYPLSKEAKLSKKLLRVAAINPEAILLQRLARKYAVTQEKAFLTGSAAGQPLGLYIASADGIPTTRDVSIGNTTTTIEFDGLKEAKYTLKAQYWQKAAWNFHRDAIKQLAKKKDGEGRYIWEAAVRAGEPDRLLEFPFYVSEYAPNTFTTGLYVGLLGDFSYYWIADGMNFEIQVLLELYARTNQIGYIGRGECDAMPVLSEAFTRVKLA